MMALLFSYLLFSNFELELFNMKTYQVFQGELQQEHPDVKDFDDILENIRKTVKNIANEQTDEGVRLRNECECG